MWNASAKSGWQGNACHVRVPPISCPLLAILKPSRIILLCVGCWLEPSNTKAYGGIVNVQQQLRQGRSEDARSVAEVPTCCVSSEVGRSLVKVQVQPLVLYDLHIRALASRQEVSVDVNGNRSKRRPSDADSSSSPRRRDSRSSASLRPSRATRPSSRVSLYLASSRGGKTIRKKSAPQQADASTTAASLSSTPVSDDLAEPLTLLTNLRTSLRSDEFELYEALQRTFFLDGINDVRKALLTEPNPPRIVSLHDKEASTKKEQTDLGGCSYDEPEYLEAGRRAFPGSCYIIRRRRASIDHCLLAQLAGLSL